MKEKLRPQEQRGKSQLMAEVYKGAIRAREIAEFVCDRPLRIAFAVGLAYLTFVPLFSQK